MLWELGKANGDISEHMTEHHKVSGKHRVRYYRLSVDMRDDVTKKFSSMRSQMRMGYDDFMAWMVERCWEVGKGER